jgi:hypothetical protein
VRASRKKPLAEGAVDGQRRRHDLEGHLAVKGFLHGEINGGHAAVAEFMFDGVAGEVHICRPFGKNPIFAAKAAPTKTSTLDRSYPLWE